MVSEEKKNIIYQMLSIHPSKNWYRQCLEMHCTSDEMDELEEDEYFLREIEAILFLEKQKLMAKRNEAIEMAAVKGNWKGYDKLLQEVDHELFSVGKDVKIAGEGTGHPVQIILQGRSSDQDSSDG